MSFDNIKIYMQNGKLTDLEINYYINKLKKYTKVKITTYIFYFRRRLY